METVNAGTALMVAPQKPQTLMSTISREELDNYSSQKKQLMQWLASNLIEGVHYGYPPKTPRPADSKSWKAKPSLYKSGALTIVDLLQLRADFSADQAARAMFEHSENLLCIRCELYSRATGELVGQGRGTYRVGQKGMNENSALKMAQKSALVDAVINTVPIAAELYTQDLEDIDPSKLNGGQKIAGAPRATIEMITQEQLAELGSYLSLPNLTESRKARLHSIVSGETRPTREAAEDILETCRALDAALLKKEGDNA